MIHQLKKFIERYSLSPQPFLLALSGGPDSLCLFHCLLACQREGLVSFHVAHVNHGWRLESDKEAILLRQMMEGYGIPYHEKKLDPSALSGNLEAAFREERQIFFSELHQQYSFQGVLLGHQRNDQVETVLKRVLEGSHWSHFAGLQPELKIRGMRFLRPLLTVDKKEIYHFLEQNKLIPFEDSTNADENFLRARMRQTVIPWLNENFGKQVPSALLSLSQEMAELKEYFFQRLSPILDRIVRGPWGLYLDLQESSSLSLVEIKYLIRMVCEGEGFFLSRAMLQRMAAALIKGEAHLSFEMGLKKMEIDRRCFFILVSDEKNWQGSVLLQSEASYELKSGWKVTIQKIAYDSSCSSSSWKEGWSGQFKAWIPTGSYDLSPLPLKANFIASQNPIQEWWASHKIPAFLRTYFPVICQKGRIFHEFLTGRSSASLVEGQECLKVELIYKCFQ